MEFQEKLGKDIIFNIAPEQIKEMLKHENVFERVVRIGLKNILQDSHASISRESVETDDEYKAQSLALVQKTFDALLLGEVRAFRAIASRKSGLEAIIEKLARRHIVAMAKAKGISDKDRIAEIVTKNLEKFSANAEIIAAARTEFEAQKQTIGEELDL